MHRLEPPQSHELRDPAGILALSLHLHRFEGVA
jgi:hypothetical protein